jgi:hypothetical protein
MRRFEVAEKEKSVGLEKLLDTMKKDYVVTLTYPDTLVKYMFPHNTKRGIIGYLSDGNFIGEACTDITFREVTNMPDGVMFLGSTILNEEEK